MCPDDTRADDRPATLRATAELLDQRARDTAGAEERHALHEYAQLYREMAVLAEQACDSDGEA